MNEDEVRAWVEGMYHRIYSGIPAGDLRKLDITYRMESKVVDGFLDAIQGLFGYLERLDADEAKDILEQYFRMFMAGWGRALAWREELEARR